MEEFDTTPLEYQGQYASCKVFTQNVEGEAVKQIYAAMNCPAFEGAGIRVMPDVHSGKGCVVGFTSPINLASPRIVPNIIGVDIGCGVQAVLLKGVSKGEINFQEFDKHLRDNVPSGFKNRETVYKGLPILFKRHVDDRLKWEDFEAAVCALSEKVGDDSGKTWKACGSLGSGNHFLELDRDVDTKEIWLTVHSGSRHLGLAVAEYHQRIATKNMGPYGGLAWLEGVEAQAYLTDMRITQKFAMLSRIVMLDVLTQFFEIKLKDSEIVTSVHNYIGDDNVIRKGAVAALAGQKVVIPWNMKDGLILGVGKGNEDWNNSAPHGAGRKMSRGDAKRKLSLSDFEKSMKQAGVWSSCISKHTLDEAPDAYKPSEEVSALIGDTVEILSWLKPVYNFKASEKPEGTR